MCQAIEKYVELYLHWNAFSLTFLLSYHTSIFSLKCQMLGRKASCTIFHLMTQLGIKLTTYYTLRLPRLVYAFLWWQWHTDMGLRVQTTLCLQSDIHGIFNSQFWLLTKNWYYKWDSNQQPISPMHWETCVQIPPIGSLTVNISYTYIKKEDHSDLSLSQNKRFSLFHL